MAPPHTEETFEALRWNRLPFRVEPQEEPGLCWAAVASAVSRFYSPVRWWAQEQIARCGSGEDFMKHWYADKALALCGNLERKLTRPLTFAELTLQIEGGRVVVARVQWAFGGGHLVALSGVSSAGGVWVEDPKYGPGACRHRDLLAGEYLRFGWWSHSYTTRPGR